MKTYPPNDLITCPSAPCSVGSDLLGIVNEAGKISFFGKPVPITEDFVATANSGNAPEARFRFSAKCVETKCKQWSGTKCSVGSAVAEISVQTPPFSAPNCGIRSQCRWFKQESVKACLSCALIITKIN